MPSVEMRRSTRVFVPKAKDVEFVRVLRSGRRLRVESDEKWFDSLVDNKKSKQKNGWGHHPMDIDPVDIEPVNTVRVSPVRSGERVIKNVYSRKRKRMSVESGSLSEVKEKRKFGLHFVRRHKRKVDCDNCDDVDDRNGLLSIVVESPSCFIFARILALILEHMTRKYLSVVHLSAFLASNPISPTFTSLGIRSFRGLPCTSSRGLCQIFGAKQLMPLFTVDFSAVPLCFVHLHTSICFRSVWLSWLWLMDFCGKSGSTGDFHDSPFFVDVQSDLPLTKAVNSSSVVGKTASRNLQCRVGVITRSRSKRRHRSFRPRRARNLSVFDQHRGRVPSPSHCLAHRKNPLLLGRNQEPRKSARKNCAVDTPQKLSANALSLNVDVDSISCSASILVIETEMCHRLEGAEITLDVSDSNEWVLAVKKDGLIRYCFKAQYEMRPCATNRFSHAVIWTGENGWKLEFPERNDWSIFKELYKACAERNAELPSPAVKIIPVPGVREVTNAWDSSGATFERSDSYIRMTGDELSKALSCQTANYDMDSEDEEWLGNLNSKSDASDELLESTFELMIDAFEKASFCNPEDCSDEKAATNLCMDLASSVVVEEVHRYWMKKRTQKNGPLLLVYQLNQSKRALLISKPVLRKKRSLKRQASHLSQRGRGKDSSVLQAIAAEQQSAVEDQNAILKAEEAKTSANKSMEMAINKRERAQLLMENADLAVYRATIALRIAEAAQVAEAQQAAAHFLD